MSPANLYDNREMSCIVSQDGRDKQAAWQSFSFGGDGCPY